MSVTLNIKETKGTSFDFKYTESIGSNNAAVPLSNNAAVPPSNNEAKTRLLLVKDLKDTKISLKLISIQSTTSIKDAVNLMKNGIIGEYHYASRPESSSQMKVRFLLVFEGNKFVGVFSQGDATKAIAQNIPTSTAVSTLMTRNPICVKETDTLKSCLELMLTYRIRHLVVIDNDKQPILIVSKWDIIELERVNNVQQLNKIPLSKRYKEYEKIFFVLDTDSIVFALNYMLSIQWKTGICPRPLGATTYAIRSLIVNDKDGKLAGLITQSDFLKCIQFNIPYTNPVSAIMTQRKDLIIASDTESCSKGLHLMSLNSTRKLVLVSPSINKPMNFFGSLVSGITSAADTIYNHPEEAASDASSIITIIGVFA